ncbi:MAG: hypothetical protein GY694_17200, partial [Gammaproteobacteria bacterium]|nr:hypothetical protein [Gammaproteobacteria bacterium]
KKATEYEQLANQYYEENKYDKAEENYGKAINIISNTLENKENIYEQLVSKGTKELDNNELEQSRKSFLKAQTIHKEEPIISRFLERIGNRNKVLKLYEDSIEFEKNRDLTQAIIVIEQALELEPEYETINKQIIKLQRKKNEIDFNHLVGKILTLLDQEKINLNELKKIKNYLNQLKKTINTDQIIKELEEKYRIKKESYYLKKYYQSALKHEAQEHWLKAKNDYEKILNINLNHSKALAGKERVKFYLYINELIDSIILLPERLQDDEIFTKSKKSLNFAKSEIREKKSAEKLRIPRLIKKIDKAELLIKNASTLIDVTLHSDNETTVSIYRVGRFGQFNNKKLQMRPGKYTIIGVRSGYKDIRTIKNISARDKSLEISVICSEKI